MDKRNCGTCFHRGVVFPAPEQEVHLCRGDLPKAALVNTEGGMQCITLWPQVNPEIDVCGAWKPVADTCADPGVPQ